MGVPLKDLSCPHCGKSIAEVVQHAIYGGQPPPSSGKPEQEFKPRRILGITIGKPKPRPE